MFPIRNSEKVLTELSKQAQDNKYEFHRIYRLLCNPNIFMKAYDNIYKNTKNSASGIGTKIVDDFNEDLVRTIIESLKNESYQAKPVNRTYISKKNGKIDTLDISNFNDKLVQEVCRMILETIYEPIFSDNLHSFKPNRSCHTALQQIQNTFRGANWFIRGNIKECFDNMNHQELIHILRKKIKDERFLRLIWKFLKAGCMENWNYKNTYSGTPQGSILNPLLANIYINELDEYIENIIKFNLIKNNKGDVQHCKMQTPDYRKVNHKLYVLEKTIDTLAIDDKVKVSCIKEYKQLEKDRNSISFQLGLKNYKNVQYVRYADDFILAVSGSKKDSQEIKNELSVFLKNKLKLELSKEKMLITYSHNRTKFLNYEIQVRNNSKVFKNKNTVKKRTENLDIVLYMPHDIVNNYIVSKKVVEDINAPHWRGKARPFMQFLSDLEIITLYNAEIKGLYDYYSMAENVSDQMNMVYHIMEYSCLKTLAGKHKCSVAKIKAQYKTGKYWGVKYSSFKGQNKIRYFYNQGFKTRNNPIEEYDFDEVVSIVNMQSKLNLSKK